MGELDLPVAEQLQQAQKTHDDDQPVLRGGDQLSEPALPRSAQLIGHGRDLIADVDGVGVQVLHLHMIGLQLLTGQGLLRQCPEVFGGGVPDQFRQDVSHIWVVAGSAREASRVRRDCAAHLFGDLFERLVLQQPGEEQVPGLQGGDVLL